MVATHGGRPFPQGPGDDRGDQGCEPVGDHRHLEPARSGRGAGEAADPRPDNEHPPPDPCVASVNGNHHLVSIRIAPSGGRPLATDRTVASGSGSARVEGRVGV